MPDTWRESLRLNGYAQFPGLTPPHLIRAAREAIDQDLCTNYDPARQTEYDNQSYCPDLLGMPPILDIIMRSPVYSTLEELFGIRNLWISSGQVAIRRAHNHPQPIPPHPHIDGFASGLNAVPRGNIYNHTVLVGIFLTPVLISFAGNFTVWPGSHYIYERYFRERGRRALTEPSPVLDLGEPVQLMCEPGDVVLAHYHLGHTAAVNTSDSDRIAVFFRVVLRKVEKDRWLYLTNLWEGWRL